MKKYPLVSIITPSFNSFPYLEDNIRSVREQDYPNIEHIIIDGGSTDGTIDILKRYPHLVWISEPDNGQSDAINKGFQLSNGEIIGWLNSDDTYEIGAINSVINIFISNHNIDIVYSDLRIIDEFNNELGKVRSQNFNLEKLLISNFIKQPTVFMRRNVIEKLMGLNVNLHYTMDRDFWVRAGLAGFKYHYLENSFGANFRLIPGTKSYSKLKEFHNEWNNVLVDYFSQSDFSNISPIKKKKIIKKNQAQFHWACVLEAIRERNIKKMFIEFIKVIQLDKKYLRNRGTWYYFFTILTGSSFDRVRKYKKMDEISKYNGSFKTIIKEDFFRYSSKKFNVISCIITAYKNLGFRAILFYRIGKVFLYRRQIHFAGAIERLIIKSCYCQISLSATIDSGFLIAHTFGLVIGGGTIIGKNCDVRQNVTLGGNFSKRDQNGRTQPRLGDNVSVGAGAVVIGPIIVGANSIIGANSVVTRDVPENVIVLGVPAKIIKNRWEDSLGRKL